MKRPLWQTLAEVAAAVSPDEGTDLVTVTSVWVDLPIQVSVAWRDGGSARDGEDPLAGIELLADLPAWRWTTPFDERIGRLQVSLQSQPAVALVDNAMVADTPAVDAPAANVPTDRPAPSTESPHPEGDHGTP